GVSPEIAVRRRYVPCMGTIKELLDEYNKRAAAANLPTIKAWKGTKAKLEERLAALPLPPTATDDLTVAEIARQLGLSPKTARATLRRAGMKAVDGRWPTVKLNSDEHVNLIALLKGRDAGTPISTQSKKVLWKQGWERISRLASRTRTKARRPQGCRVNGRGRPRTVPPSRKVAGSSLQGPPTRRPRLHRSTPSFRLHSGSVTAGCDSHRVSGS